MISLFGNKVSADYEKLAYDFSFNYCIDNSCDFGEGDCDANDECADGLTCGVNNCLYNGLNLSDIDGHPVGGADCCKGVLFSRFWSKCQAKSKCSHDENHLWGHFYFD